MSQSCSHPPLLLPAKMFKCDMVKKILALSALLLSTAYAQTYPTYDQSFDMYISSREALNNGISFYGLFKQSDCVLASTKISDAAFKQFQYNINLNIAIKKLPSSEVSNGRVNDLLAHSKVSDALDALSKAIKIRCSGGDDDISQLYYQISSLAVSVSNLYYEKR